MFSCATCVKTKVFRLWSNIWEFHEFIIENEGYLSVMWNLLVKPGEVEFILDVVLVDFAKELVASQTTEPRNP